jgi:hypothetical protein
MRERDRRAPTWVGFYKPGAFVAITREPGYQNHYVQKTDATKEQEQCAALPVDVPTKKGKKK